MIYQADREVKPQIKKSVKKIQPTVFHLYEICFIEIVNIDNTFRFYERILLKNQNSGLYFFFTENFFVEFCPRGRHFSIHFWRKVKILHFF